MRFREGLIRNWANYFQFDHYTLTKFRCVLLGMKQISGQVNGELVSQMNGCLNFPNGSKGAAAPFQALLTAGW